VDRMTDFLLELRSEEIPARMQAGARATLEKLFREQMATAGVSLGALTVWSTPRRLVLIARDLPEGTAAVSEELKGPKTSAPPQALEGFLRKTGLTQDQLTERAGIYFAVTEKPGRATRDVLAEAIPAIVRAFPWPKSQRWGAASISTESIRWVRPLSGIVAIFGEDLVECEVGGIRSGYATKGHRFHHPDEITIGGAHDYQDKLRACHVLVDHEERQNLIRDKASAAASAAGLTLVSDEGLVIENAGLTEWPVPLLGRFDEAFLEVPPEVIQLTARTNQKYFVCEDSAGKLANAFVCTANIDAIDGGEGIVAGNRKVLAARLSDARFFWEQDRKKTLAQHAEGLARITFHEKLGTVADKVERVAKLARWLVEEGIVNGADAEQAEQAARLAKADLVTEMVGEFPELQGLMGGYYARAEGLPDAVADAIRDHYKPVGQGDEVPTAPVTVAVSLADKLDTLFQFFMAGLVPTGSRDPFALRRAVLGVLALLSENGLRLPLSPAIERAYRELIGTWRATGAFACLSDGKEPYEHDDGQKGWLIFPEPVYEYSDLLGDSAFKYMLLVEYYGYDDTREIHDFDLDGNRVLEFVRFVEFRDTILDFFAERLKVQQREAGVRHDLIDAVFAAKNDEGGGEDDLVRLLARVHALQAFIGSEDGTNLHAGYKRAANLLKKEDWRGIEGEIARTGEEDPLANVDDPDLAPIIAAKMAERHQKPLSYTPEPAEKALMNALDTAGPTAAAAVEAEDFAGAMAALASLRAPIDAFFDDVTVNDADPEKRQARLSLLDRFRVAVHNVADFSKIEG
jgi:glycyl-tRNA synthetase beta chain